LARGLGIFSGVAGLARWGPELPPSDYRFIPSFLGALCLFGAEIVVNRCLCLLWRLLAQGLIGKSGVTKGRVIRVTKSNNVTEGHVLFLKLTMPFGVVPLAVPHTGQKVVLLPPAHRASRIAVLLGHCYHVRRQRSHREHSANRSGTNYRT